MSSFLKTQILIKELDNLIKKKMKKDMKENILKKCWYKKVYKKCWYKKRNLITFFKNKIMREEKLEEWEK